MRKIFIGVVLLIMVSCGVGRDVEADLARLMAEPITLPSNSTLMVQGKDTVINGFLESDCKMVIYTDSASCSSCALNKLYLWQDMIDYSLENGEIVKFYFIFNPPSNENIRLTLRNSMLDYPVLLDSLGEFERLNPHLPKNKAMHTFLLDENNNVILVGNPLQNKEIEKMFYKEVEQRLGHPTSN